MRALYLSLFALVVVAALLWRGFSQSPAEQAQTSSAHSTSRDMATNASTRAPRSGQRVTRQSYALEYSHQVYINGQDLAPTWVNATWTTEPLGTDNDSARVEVALSHVDLDGAEALPEPGAMNTRFHIALDPAGGLDRLGFAPGTSIEARGLLTTLACALWYTPGEGDRWTADEDDRTGRYRAVYEWRDSSELVRRRQGYLLARTPQGLDRKRAQALATDGATRFFFDADGLREVIVDEHIRMDMGEGMPSMEVAIQATLRRVRSERVHARVAERLPLEPIRAHGQAGEPSQRQLDVSQLGGAGVEDLLAKLAQVRGMPVRSKAEEAWRAEALIQLRALLRVEPDSAARLAQAMRDLAGDDPRMASVLAGALSDAATPEATQALAQLLSEDLPLHVRQNIAAGLALTRAPSADSARALTDALADPDIGSSAALALGAQAGALADREPEVAATAIDLLLEQYTQATDPSQRVTYLNALANSGDPRALPVMRAAVTGDDSRLAELATYGLRFIPGDEADALLAAQLDGATSNEIKVQAIRAIGYRTPTAWQTTLRDAYARYESVGPIRDAIDQVFASWGV